MARAGADHALERVGQQPVLELGIFALQAGHMEGPPEQQLELTHVDRFGQEIVRAGPYRLQGVFFFALTGDDDHLGEPVDCQQGGEGGQAFIWGVRDAAADRDPA